MDDLLKSSEPCTDIVYLDKYFAVVVKHVGEVCQEDCHNSLSARVKPLIQEKLGHNVEVCSCIHRLDQPVSGLCIIGLTKDTIASVSCGFSTKSIRKSYCAITEKALANGTSNGQIVRREEDNWHQLEGCIIFNSKQQKARIVGNGKGKKALLRYKKIGEGKNYDFLLVEPLTGRSHQIRCQLASTGLPIKGDLKYGAKRSERSGGIRLHAWKLDFTHPFTGENLVFTCLPPQMDSLWQACTSFLSK